MNTAKVTDYRTLRFQSLGDVRRELDVLERAHGAGTLRASGNWSAGQIASHLAAFIDYGFDGYPPELANPPAIIRFILKRMKNRYLTKSLPRGVRIPKIPSGTVGADDAPFDRACARLRACLERLESRPPANRNPIFGPLSHDEWKSLHMRHCELHLGYLHPR